MLEVVGVYEERIIHMALHYDLKSSVISHRKISRNLLSGKTHGE